MMALKTPSQQDSLNTKKDGIGRSSRFIPWLELWQGRLQAKMVCGTPVSGLQPQIQYGHVGQVALVLKILVPWGE